MKQNRNRKTRINLPKFYYEKEVLHGGLQQDKVNFPYERTYPSDYLNEFNQEEKTKIFNDAYYCIGLFYRIIE